jgi:hypothetical protein
LQIIWGEKEKEKAFMAWKKFNELSEKDQDQLGQSMIQIIEDKLIQRIESILDDTIDREIEKVTLELVSNLGELKVYEFKSVDSAIDFLKNVDLDSVFVTKKSITLFESPPSFE